MKMRTISALFFSVLAFTACTQNDDSAADQSEEALLKSATIAVNDVAVQSVAQEANYETDYFSEYEHLLRRLAHYKGKRGNLLSGYDHNHYVEGDSPVITIDTAATGYPITITIEYGDSTETTHGRIISGTVKVEINGDKNTDGSTRKISYINCVIDSIGINGTSTETFNGDNTTTRKVTVESDATFTLQSDGTTIERSANEVREWLSGLDTTTDRSDDKIQTTGSISATSSVGDTYSRVITDPLISLGDCRYPVQGIMQYSQNGSVIAEVNYGDGTCDNVASLTTGGTTSDIELQGKLPKSDLTNGKKKGNK